MVSDNKIKPYGIYESVYDLQYMELYSGSERDPVVDASVYAMDNLAFDTAGMKLPFVTEVGLPAQFIDRDNKLLEDIPRVYRRLSQKVVVTIIVFRNMKDYFDYKHENNYFY